jgi:spermidine synthase
LNFINGLIHGVRPGYTFTYETMEALRYHQHFTDVLVIGFGTGSFVETLLRDSNVERVTLVELNSALLTNLAKIPALKSVLDDPKLEIIIDDGRRYLIRNERQFDLVMIDPLRQTTANSNNLYSREFFETIDRSLSDSGIFLVWADEIPVVTNTLASVFPQLRLTVIDQGDHGFFLASRKGLSGPKRSLSDLLASYSQEERHNIIEVRSRLTPVPTDQLRFDREFPINEDLKPVNEYYLGRPTQ